MKKLLFIIAILLIPIFVLAQINYSIKGKIISSNDYLPAGNVIVLHPNDSTFITGNFFMDGKFEINDIQNEEVLLQFSSLEFDDTFITVNYNNQSVLDLGEIQVQKSGVALDEIVVKSRRPIYNQKADGTVEVLIQNTTLAASSSVNEILSKSPDVIMDEENGISIFGKGNTILYLNNKRITASQLSLIAPSNIQKIEIIRNPSAKYDAEGAAVIHIKTIQNISDGYQAKFKQNITYSDFAGLNTFSNLSLNYNKGRFSSNAYYSLLMGEDRHILYTTRNREDAEIYLSTDLTTEWKFKYDNFSYYGLGIQYDLKDKSYFSLEYSGSFEKEGGNTLSNNTIADNQSTSLYKSDINVDEKQINNSLSFNYNKPLDTLGSSFFLGTQYIDFGTGNDNLILEESIEQNDNLSRSLKNLSNLDIQILSGQADYTKVFNSKNTIEIGARYSHVKNDSYLDFLVSDDASLFILDADLSNIFNYDETIGAAYFSFKSKLNDKINYTIGLRSELTKYNMMVSSQEDLIQDKYVNFFPNFSTQLKISDDFHLGFSYTSRINRPAYQRLNPVLLYQDPYTSIQGNPELKPEIVHGFELNSKLKKTNIKVGYNHYINPMGGGAIRGNDPKSYILQRFNFDKRQILFSSISRTFENKWMTSTNTLNMKFTSIDESEYGFEKLAFRPNLYFYSNNRFNVSDLFNVEVLLWCLGKNNDGVYQRYESYNASLTLDKSFLDNSLKIRLTANDIFKTVRAWGDYQVGPTDIFFKRRWNTDYFRVSVMYNLGKLKQGNYKNKAVGDTESNRTR